MAVARHLKRPTRDSNGSGRASPPIWPCSSWGLPCHGLLPAVRWALTPPFHPYPQAGGMFSVALSVAFRRPGVTWQLALWSSDFPRYDQGRTVTVTLHRPCASLKDKVPAIVC